MGVIGASEIRQILDRVIQQHAEIALGVAMQVPGGRIVRNGEMLDEAGFGVDLGQEHGAIDTRAFDAAAMVIGRAQPGVRAADYRRAFGRLTGHGD